MEDELIALVMRLIAELVIPDPGTVTKQASVLEPRAAEHVPASPDSSSTAGVHGGDPLHRQVRRVDSAEAVTWDYTERLTEGFRGLDGGPLSDISRALLAPGRDSQTTEAVIGSDDRTRVLNSHEFPWRMIVALRIEMSGSVIRHGTGFLVGPSTVLTAGHCVYEPRYGGWADRVEVRAGLNGSAEPFGSSGSSELSASLGWVDLQDHRYDYAFVELDEPLGERTGWFALGVLSSAEVYGSAMHVCGYPSDLNRGAWNQWHSGGRTGLVDGQKLYYDADTFGGTSGGPVWISRVDGSQVVVGIHAYGTQLQLNGTLATPHNSATRIIPQILERATANGRAGRTAMSEPEKARPSC